MVGEAGNIRTSGTTTDPSLRKRYGFSCAGGLAEQGIISAHASGNCAGGAIDSENFDKYFSNDLERALLL